MAAGLWQCAAMIRDDLGGQAAIPRHRSKWREAVLICRKCSKKVRGGFGRKGRESLRDALKDELRAGKGRSSTIGLVEVGCFKLCPKRAVTVACGTRPGELLAVPAGADLEAVISALGLERVVAGA